MNMVGIQFVTPRFILPLFNKFTSLEEGELRAAIFHYARSHEREANRFAVETTNDRNALVSALKKLSADNLSNLSPHPLYVAIPPDVTTSFSQADNKATTYLSVLWLI